MVFTGAAKLTFFAIIHKINPITKACSTTAIAVDFGSRFTAIRSTTGIGFDSSTNGGSFTGNNTSRRLLHKEAKTPSSLFSVM